MYKQEEILTWAKEKGILDKGNVEAQAEKTLEECMELLEAVKAGDNVEIIDAIGDIYVTIVIQAYMQGLPFKLCVVAAYNVISKRTGTMVNGMFVKDD